MFVKNAIVMQYSHHNCVEENSILLAVIITSRQYWLLDSLSLIIHIAAFVNNIIIVIMNVSYIIDLIA